MYHGLSPDPPASKQVIHRNGPDNLTTPMFTLATASFGNVPQCPPSSGRHTWDAYVSTWAGCFYVAFVTGVAAPGPPVTSRRRTSSLADRPVRRPRAAPSLRVPSTMSSRASCRAPLVAVHEAASDQGSRAAVPHSAEAVSY